MLQEKMTQDEIDILLKNLNAGDIENISTNHGKSSDLNPDEVKKKYNNIIACKKRYAYALLNESYEYIKEAARNLHYAAFSNWLFIHKLRREEYYRLMNREAKKRGMREPFKRFV